MKHITIDCAQIADPRQLHILLAKALEFPDWYGHNLDALFDCLTEMAEPVALCLTGWDSLGPWKEGFRSVFRDAAGEEPELEITFQ